MINKKIQTQLALSTQSWVYAFKSAVAHRLGNEGFSLGRAALLAGFQFLADSYVSQQQILHRLGWKSVPSLFASLIEADATELTVRDSTRILYLDLPSGALLASFCLHSGDPRCYGTAPASVLGPELMAHVQRRLGSTGLRLHFSATGNDPGPECLQAHHSTRPLLAHEQARVDRLRLYLDSGHSRTVLLSGPPGVGKTSFAVEACKQLCGGYVLVTADSDCGRTWSALASLGPKAIILDDLDRTSEPERTVAWLDKLGVELVFVTANNPERLPAAARRTGRVDMVFSNEDLDNVARERILLHGVADIADRTELREVATLVDGLRESDLIELRTRVCVGDYQDANAVDVIKELRTRRVDIDDANGSELELQP